MKASAGAWYRTGLASIEQGSDTLTGTDTYWQTDVIAIDTGDIFSIDAKTWYEVIGVLSDTEIKLDREFEGETQNDATYAIIRNTSGTIPTRLAGQIAKQFNQKQRLLDEIRTWLISTNASEVITDSHGIEHELATPHSEKFEPFVTVTTEVSETLRAGNVYALTVDANTAIGFENVINDSLCYAIAAYITKSDDSYIISWPANLFWTDDNPPEIEAGSFTIITFLVTPNPANSDESIIIGTVTGKI